MVSKAIRDRVEAERGPSYTEDEIERGDFPPILSLLSAELVTEVTSAKINGEPLYVPRLRTIRAA